VREKILHEGGAIQHGWCIWELPGLFIEAEFHAVWVSPLDHMVDITPKEEAEILFLIDPSAEFDETSFSRRDNYRLPVKDHPVVQEFIRAAEEHFRFLEAGTIPNERRLMRIDRDQHDAFLHRRRNLELNMLNLPIGRNDMCRCGSAEKFKKCCANKENQ
jgi:uncharacterized protein YecA (UPF0149 family)